MAKKSKDQSSQMCLIWDSVPSNDLPSKTPTTLRTSVSACSVLNNNDPSEWMKEEVTSTDQPEGMIIGASQDSADCPIAADPNIMAPVVASVTVIPEINPETHSGNTAPEQAICKAQPGATTDLTEDPAIDAVSAEAISRNCEVGCFNGNSNQGGPDNISNDQPTEVRRAAAAEFSPKAPVPAKPEPISPQTQTPGSSQATCSETNEESTVEKAQQPTTEIPNSPTDKRQPKKYKLSGRRTSHPTVIINEQDCLNKSEREILDRMKELNREQLKLFPNSPTDQVQAGYSDLLTESATCTKTVYRTVPRLIDKGFIDLVQEGNEAGQGSRAIYRIVPEHEVKTRRLEKRLTHWFKVGSGRKTVTDPEESDGHDD